MAFTKPDIEVQNALDSLTPSDYLDFEGIEYRRTVGSRGTQLNLRTCPSCGGSEYKVYLNEESGLGNCFHGSCEKKYNKWSFIRAHTGLNGRELNNYILHVAGEMGWRPKKKMVSKEVQKAELIIPESFEIPHDGRNLNYLENRGISSEVAKYFHLRFSKTGVFKYKDDEGNEIVQSYKDRVIIPIYDMDGKLVSFQGRDVVGNSHKKYLFPPGFAATGAHLYNAHNAIGKEHVVIGEGAFDVMAQKIAFSSVRELEEVEPIGTFGKHLSFGDENSQYGKFVRLKKAGLKTVTFMWDSEKAATKAAVEAGLMLTKLGLVIRIAILPIGKDPNEVSAKEVVNAYYKAIVLNRINATRLLLQNN